MRQHGLANGVAFGRRQDEETEWEVQREERHLAVEGCDTKRGHVQRVVRGYASELHSEWCEHGGVHNCRKGAEAAIPLANTHKLVYCT